MSNDLNQPSGGPAVKSGGKAVKILGVVVVLALVAAAAAWHLGNKKVEREAAEAFALAMDKVAGEGNWTARETSYSIRTKTLTATDVAIDLDHVDPTMTEPMTIKTIVIVGGLGVEELRTLEALDDWRGQSDRHLADSVTLSGVSLESQDGRDRMVLGLGGAALGGLDLVAAGPDNSPGLLGFFKSLRIQSLALDSFSLSADSPDHPDIASAKFKLASLEASDLHAGEGLELPFDGLALVASLSAAKASASGFEFGVSDDGGDVFSLSIADGSLSDASKLSFGLLSLKGLAVRASAKTSVPGRSEPVKVDFSLSDLALNGLDLMPLYRRTLEVWDASIPGDVESFVGGFNMLSDMVTLPYSLDSAATSGWELVIDGLFKISLAEASFTGPSEAGVIPPSQRHRLEGLRIELPESESDIQDFNDAWRFSRDFGQRVFSIRFDNSITYDQAAGAYNQTAAPLLGIDDLVVINGELDLIGLTPDLVEAMSMIPLESAENIVFFPDFLELGLARFRLEIHDVALVDRLLAFYAARNETNVESARGLFGYLLRTFPSRIGMEDPFIVGESLAAFIESPGSLVLDVSPSQPLNSTTAFTAGSTEELVNSLNITVAVNGRPPLPVRLTLPEPAADEDLDRDLDGDLE